MEISDMTHISRLPFEVLENIFCFLDGRSFCISRQVCKAWNEVVKNMQSKNELWKQFCLKEIPQNVLEEILGFKDISWIGEIEWKSTYKKWFQSQIISTSHVSMSEIHAFLPNPITCIAVSGSFVLTGHSTGILCVWHLDDGTFLKKYICHLRMITDMALIDLLNLGSYLGQELQPWAHHHVITISKDRYLHVVSVLECLLISGPDMHLSCHGDDLKQIVVFGDTIAISCRDNTVSLWKMSLVTNLSFRLDISLVQKIIGPEDILMSLGLWLKEIQCVSYSGKLKTLKPSEGDWIEKKYFKNSYTENGSEAIVRVTAAFLFRSRTVIMLTADGKLIISTNKKHNRHYYPMRQLRTSVVSVALHGPILALGGENGNLFLFHVSNENMLMELDLSKPDFKQNLSEASIISIHISYQDNSPVIAASTTEFVHVIKWYKPKRHFDVKILYF